MADAMAYQTQPILYLSTVPPAASGAQINDAVTNGTATWSSTRIAAAISAAVTALSLGIDDDATGLTTTWSSARIAEAIAEAITSSLTRVLFTVTGATFLPRVALTTGSTATVTWEDSMGTVLATGLTPTISFGSSGVRQVRLNVRNGSAAAFDEIETLNLGFDNSQDAGRYQLSASYNLTPTGVTAVDGIGLLTGLRNFMAAGTTLTGTLDFSGLSSLEYVECFGADVTGVVLTGCTSLVRLCLEANQLTSLDLNPVAASLYDLRAAAQTGGALSFAALTANMDHLYHLCIRDQTVTGLPSASRLPAVEEEWIWNTGQTGAFTVAPTATSAMVYGNAITTLTDAGRTATGGLLDASQCGLTAVTLTTPWANLDLAGNSLDTTTVDAVLATVEAWGTSNGTLDLSGNGIPTAAGLADIALLEARGWTVTVETGAGPTVLWQDLFDRADGAAGNNWTVEGDGALTIASNDLVFTGGSGYQRVLNPAGGALPADLVLELSIPAASQSSAWWGILGRVGNSTGVRVLFSDNRTTLTIGAATGPSDGNVTVDTVGGFPASWSQTQDHTLVVHMHGSTIDVYCDGQLSHTATVTINQALTGGSVGLCGESNGRAWHSLRVLDAVPA